MAEHRGAWHGDPELKATVVRRMHQHRAADAFWQGFYQELDPEKALGYKGCALGCMVEKQQNPDRVDSFHELVERQLGIPERVAEAIDNTFEDLDFEQCAAFAVAAVEAIPVGADLTAVGDTFWGEMDAADYEMPGSQAAARLLELLSGSPSVLS